MGDDDVYASFLRHLDSVQCLRDGSYLVEFDQDRVSCLFLNASLDSFRVCDVEVISNNLDSVSKLSRYLRKIVEVVFVKRIFKRSYRVCLDELLVVVL